MVLSLAACGVREDESTEGTTESKTEGTTEGTTESESKSETETETETDAADPFENIGVMTHAEYMAAEMDAPVVIEAYVQATQSWWNNKITVYLQDNDGGYLAYEMACSEEDAANLVPGVKIRVKGYKTAWEGEVELASGATFEFVEGADTYLADPVDLTGILANEEELIKHQNKLAIFKNLVVEKVEYKNGEPGDDIYVTVKQGENSFEFCVERYLTGPDTELYQAFANIQEGDVVDLTGFVYWYKGANPHVTAVDVLLSHEEYLAAEMDSYVMIEGYVQATQSWWNNQIVVYLQDRDGGYLAYNMVCTAEEAEKLVPGTKIRVKGYKTAWEGEVELAEGCTFYFVEGADTYIAEPVDLTDILANEDELIKHQNELATFKNLEIVEINYKNGEPGDDIYVTVKQGEGTFEFCVERYLTDPDTDVYKLFADLEEGDVVDITCFMYWYKGANPHIVSVSVNG